MSPEISIGIDFIAIACTIGYISHLLGVYLTHSDHGTPALIRHWAAAQEKRSLVGQIVAARNS